MYNRLTARDFYESVMADKDLKFEKLLKLFNRLPKEERDKLPHEVGSIIIRTAKIFNLEWK
jgi:hypothetical protein